MLIRGCVVANWHVKSQHPLPRARPHCASAHVAGSAPSNGPEDADSKASIEATGHGSVHMPASTDKILQCLGPVDTASADQGQLDNALKTGPVDQTTHAAVDEATTDGEQAVVETVMQASDGAALAGLEPGKPAAVADVGSVEAPTSDPAEVLMQVEKPVLAADSRPDALQVDYLEAPAHAATGAVSKRRIATPAEQKAAMREQQKMIKAADAEAKAVAKAAATAAAKAAKDAVKADMQAARAEAKEAAAAERLAKAMKKSPTRTHVQRCFAEYQRVLDPQAKAADVDLLSAPVDQDVSSAAPPAAADSGTHTTSPSEGPSSSTGSSSFLLMEKTVADTELQSTDPASLQPSADVQQPQPAVDEHTAAPSRSSADAWAAAPEHSATLQGLIAQLVQSLRLTKDQQADLLAAFRQHTTPSDAALNRLILNVGSLLCTFTDKEHSTKVAKLVQTSPALLWGSWTPWLQTFQTCHMTLAAMRPLLLNHSTLFVQQDAEVGSARAFQLRSLGIQPAMYATACPEVLCLSSAQLDQALFQAQVVVEGLMQHSYSGEVEQWKLLRCGVDPSGVDPTKVDPETRLAVAPAPITSGEAAPSGRHLHLTLLGSDKVADTAAAKAAREAAAAAHVRSAEVKAARLRFEKAMEAAAAAAAQRSKPIIVRGGMAGTGTGLGTDTGTGAGTGSLAHGAWMVLDLDMRPGKFMESWVPADAGIYRCEGGVELTLEVLRRSPILLQLQLQLDPGVMEARHVELLDYGFTGRQVLSLMVCHGKKLYLDAALIGELPNMITTLTARGFALWPLCQLFSAEPNMITTFLQPKHAKKINLPQHLGRLLMQMDAGPADIVKHPQYIQPTVFADCLAFRVFLEEQDQLDCVLDAKGRVDMGLLYARFVDMHNIYTGTYDTGNVDQKLRYAYSGWIKEYLRVRQS